MRNFRFLGLFLAVSAVTSAGFSGVARSASYSMDYAVANAGGQKASSTNYSAVAVLKTNGVGGGKSTSTSYSVEPVAGLTDTTPPAARVNDWKKF
ncbi:MAG: hypothetical protein K1X53_13160 [Candidatus Sumerlaeaceae bacterium]|nr:hypothetical protein [Candidatus Sumerlaeaceae bacterium]